MVKRWFSFFGQEIRGLHEAAYLLAVFALLSQILALVRDKLLAYSFGADRALDVYYASFRIPDLLFVSIGSLVSASVLLPYFIERFEKGNNHGRKFADSIFTVFFVVIILASVIIFFLAPWLVPKIIPGFANDPALPDLILSLRIMLFSPFFLGLSNLFSSLTQMRHRFLVYAMSPVVYNAGIIVGVIFGYPAFGISGLAIGVALGAFLHVAIQVPFIIYEGVMPRFTWRINWSDMQHVVFSTIPRTLTLSANQLASFVLISLASLMSAGSISVFNFAFNIQSVPLSLIGASYSSAVFPTLSHLLFKGNTAEFKKKMITSAQHIIFWSVPITVMFVVLRAQIVRTILGAGAFDWSDTRLTAAALAIFVVSVVGQSLVLLFIRSFYANGKTTVPLIINAISALIIIVSGFVLVKVFATYPVFQYFIEYLLKVQGQTGTAVLVLPLAFAFGVIINTIMHWVIYERSFPGFSRPVLETLYHSFAASVIMGYVTYLSLRLFAAVFPLTKVWGIFLQGLSAGFIGLVVLICILKILKNKELEAVSDTLHRKIWKVQVPPAEVEHI
ncbi:MAG: lipid II flippase MurJ [Candidatus Paceibacterota bacterium]|jgi:putative peptidoglycan lipid II flippase